MAGLSLPGIAAAVPQDFSPLQAAQVLLEEAKPTPVGTPAGTPMGRLALDYEVTEAVTQSDNQSSERIFAAGVSPEPGATPPALALEPPPLFTVYEVQPGDTVSSIAAQYGLQPESITWNNADVTDEDMLAVGQLLRIPSMDGVLYEMRLGDTLSDVAARYSVDLSTITTFTSNGIAAPDDIHENQLVFVPGGTMPPPPPEPVAEPESLPPTGDAATAAAEPSELPPAPSFTPSAGLIWPTSGPISSYMGPSHPLGIDIDLYNNPNAPIMAATSGVVTLAGGDPCCSYGLHVIIVSPGGIETLYAHLSSINVVQGQQVSQGEVLGYGGCTGYCTGNHLHFEVIDNGVREDPLSYLP
jgi:murein DD-endopeptidase MepM/ murein hydrolase activator NlpD